MSVCRNRCGLHFIRCIKPNESATAGVFNPEVVLNQLRCCGVLEVTKLAKAGYPTRFSLHNFVQHFYMLLPGSNSGEAYRICCN
jgi:myosin-5